MQLCILYVLFDFLVVCGDPSLYQVLEFPMGGLYEVLEKFSVSSCSNPLGVGPFSSRKDVDSLDAAGIPLNNFLQMWSREWDFPRSTLI